MNNKSLCGKEIDEFWENLQIGDCENEYIALCNKIYEVWKENICNFCAFRNFQIECIPETYFWIPGNVIDRSKCEDNKILYVLNNNPGCGLANQTKDEIIKEFNDKSYADISKEYYDKVLKNIVTGAAKLRFEKMQDFAKELKFDGIEDIETFFLRSERLDKNLFLKKYKNHPLVTKYTQALTEYLKDKPVLSINAAATNKSITKENVRQSEWIQYVAGIIGFDFNNAKEIPTPPKDDKITSAAIVSGNKIMIFTMGTNNIPNISDEQYDEIKKSLGIK